MYTRSPFPRGIHGIIAMLLGILSIAALVAACSNGTPSNGNGSQPGGGNSIPNILDSTNTVPTFPPVTIGAWMSNQTPNVGDNITVIAVVHLQDPGMKNVGSTQAGINVTFSGGANGTSVTDAAGYATLPIVVSSPSGVPQVIEVSTNVGGQTYKNTTFYTSLPTQPPVPITPSPTPSH